MRLARATLTFAVALELAGAASAGLRFMVLDVDEESLVGLLGALQLLQSFLVGGLAGFLAAAWLLRELLKESTTRSTLALSALSGLGAWLLAEIGVPWRFMDESWLRAVDVMLTNALNPGVQTLANVDTVAGGICGALSGAACLAGRVMFLRHASTLPNKELQRTRPARAMAPRR